MRNFINDHNIHVTSAFTFLNVKFGYPRVTESLIFVESVF